MINQYIQTFGNELIVDIRRILGAKGEYNIALKNSGSVENNCGKIIKMIPGGTINISINNGANKILDASMVFDEVSQQAEVLLYLLPQDEDLINFLNTDSLSLELEFQKVKDD